MADKHRINIFVSYSHKNEADKDRLVTHLKLMERQGLIAPWDDRLISPAEEWDPAIEKHLENADLIILLISADFLASDYCWGKEMQRAMARHDAGEVKVLPVFAQPCDWKDAPFGKLQGVPKNAKPIAHFSKKETGFAEAAKAIRIVVEQLRGADSGSTLALPSDGIADSKILRHGAQKLIGRGKELARLTRAWNDPKTHVVSIVAWGGVGKTALTVSWMGRFARQNWEGVDAYFDWTFYSQGTRDQSAASADTFIVAALKHFGDEEMAGSNASPRDKGIRLAQLVAKRKSLLILDGLEPLQYPPGKAGLDGKFKDPALEALLRSLAQKPMPGLCVLTTRVPVNDLKAFHGKTVNEWKLDRLSEEAGAELLHRSGAIRAGGAAIGPNDRELLAACREVNGHALTLQLLGSYLGLAHGGDIRKRDIVEFQEADAEVQGGHAFRVIEAYEVWLGQEEAGEAGGRQLAVLRLLGLFDRPADLGCLGALRCEPVIEGLTEPLMGLSEAEWNAALHRLTELGLITTDVEDSGLRTSDDASIDTHPLIREYFAKSLQERQPAAWRPAHRRLFETPHRDDRTSARHA